MIKLLLLCLIILYQPQVPFKISKARALYNEALTNTTACRALKDLIIDDAQPDAILLMGYKACGNMMMAAHLKNPFSKLSNFKKGKNMMEKAIEREKKNIELRFLRFMIQTNAPAILGYNKEIDHDKGFILNNFSSWKDHKGKEFVISSLKDSEYLDALEKKKLRLSL